MKFSNKINIFCVIVFILAFILRVSYINEKIGFHLDEVLSINISHRSKFLWTKEIPPDNFYTGKELKSMVLYNDTSLKDTLSDIKQMHKYNEDIPHTNLYYSILRLWFTGVDNTDVKTIVWQGTSLNLIFFILSFFIMYKILNLLFKDKTLVPFGLLVAFTNTGSISNTLFIRPYQLQECMFLLFTYIFIILYKDIEKKCLISQKNFLIASLTITLTLLTGYFAPIYISLLWMILIAYSIKTKQYKNIYFLIGIIIASLFFCKIAYLSYFKGFTSYRAKNAVDNITNFLSNFKLSIKCYLEIIVYYLFYIPCLIIFLLVWLVEAFQKNKNCSSNISKYLIITSIICSFIFILLVRFKVLRYVMPLYPIMSIIYPYSLENLNRKYFYIATFSLLFLVLSILPGKTDSDYFTLFSKIQNLYMNTKAFNEDLKTHSNYSIVLPTDNTTLIRIIPYLIDEQKYYLYSNKKLR